MSRSNSLFAASKPLNTYQRQASAKFGTQGLTAEKVAQCAWLADALHYRALLVLIETHNYTPLDALLALDDICEKTPQQLSGITRGLNLDEMRDLNSTQIDALLKHGLSNIELQGLQEAHIDALLALKRHGLKADDLRNQDWFNKDAYLQALIYLVTIKNYATHDALAYLKDLTKHQALAVSYGYESSKVPSLQKWQINVLIEQKQLEGLQSLTDLATLSKHQIDMVKELHHFGLTTDLAKKLPDDDSIKNTLVKLVKHRGFTIDESIELIEGLDNDQAAGVADGLEKQEVAGLAEPQILALIRCKTIKNGLSADDLRGKEYFNSGKHILALEQLLTERFLTAKEALAEIDGLNAYRATQVATGYRNRDDILGFTEWQLRALDNQELYNDGLRGHHLRGKDWFNSSTHFTALIQLYKRANMTAEKAIAEITGFDEEQAYLCYFRHLNRTEVLSLSSVQRKILINHHHYGIDQDLLLIAEATWLTTEEQADLLKAFTDNHLHCSTQMSLALIKKASNTPNGISELMQAIKDQSFGSAEASGAYLEIVTPPNADTSHDNNRWRCAIL